MSVTMQGGPASDQSDQLKRSLEIQTRLNSVYKKIHEAQRFSEVLPHIEADMLALLHAERLTVYQRGRNDSEIVSRYKSGNELKEIRLPFSATSIAGYVALSQKSLLVTDVHDARALASIHPQLKFDGSFDRRSGYRTRSMIVVPIKFDRVLLGVLQILNRVDGGAFTKQDLINAHELARVIGQKFRYELHGTKHPYEFLVLQKRISADQLQYYESRAQKEGTTVSHLLMSEARLTADEIGESLEHYYQVPYMGYEPEVELPQELFRNLNEAYLRRQRWIPVAGTQEEVMVLIDDPTDFERIMEIQRVLKARNYVIRVGLPEDIERYLGHSSIAPDSGVDVHDLVGRLESESVSVMEGDNLEDAVSENEATVVQLVNRLIADAQAQNASDIHIEPGKSRQSAAVRFRVDGVCRPALQIPASHVSAVVARIKIMSRLDISERRKPQDGKCALKIKGKLLELRVATLPTVNGESVVMRLLSQGGTLPIEKLNLSPRNWQLLEKGVAQPHGLLLVVGPTGSGKTTTLHAVLGHLNTPERKIWTAEDPVEITQAGLNQVQMQPKVGLTFASALRAFLRADPDVILIGEMRDSETAHSGIEASLTGHLVLSTLHTNSAPETVTRLLDLGLDPVNFADALIAVLAQRLVRTLCRNCRQAYSASEEDLKRLAHYYGEDLFPELDVKPGAQLYEPVGCEACAGSGYKGRTGMHELLYATEEVKHLIYRKGGAAELRELAVRQGMRTLMQDGIVKVLKGDTDLDQLRRVVAE